MEKFCNGINCKIKNTCIKYNTNPTKTNIEWIDPLYSDIIKDCINYKKIENV